MKIISRKTVFRLAIFVALLGTAAGAMHYYLKWAAEDFRKQLQAKGEKLLILEVAPPSVPGEQNRASCVQRAADWFATNSGVRELCAPAIRHMVAPGKAMVGWKQPYVHCENGSNTWDQAEAVIAQSREPLELLHQVIDHPALDFQLKYGQQLTLPPPHLEAVRQAAQRLSAAAVCDLHRTDTASATTNARALLALMKGLKDERQVVSQLLRIAIAEGASAISWEMLQSPAATEEQLAALQRDWMDLEFREAAENALAVERATSEATLESLRKPIGFRRLYLRAHQAEDWVTEAVAGGKELAWRLWWSYPDELRALKGYQVLLESTRFVQTNYAFRSTIFKQRGALAELRMNTLTNSAWWETGLFDKKLRILFSRNVAGSSGYLESLEQVEVAKQMTLSALALKRYQLRHGTYPPELAALVPDFVPSVPRDPVNGKPLRYQSTGKTYLLYSIGDDGVDNGGDPTVPPPSESLAWLKGRDHVWPSPATDQEIQAYQKRLSFRPH
jgi:hypothetical protein